jgi:hypothetical protein
LAAARTKVDSERVFEFKNTEDLVEDFFDKFPETEKGKLKDSIEIEYLGFKYNYHPKHNTYYGKIAKVYMLLPVIMRYFYKELHNVKADDPRVLPTNYKGGNSRGVQFYADDDEEVTTPVVKKREVTPFNKKPCMVYFSMPGTTDRIAASVLVPDFINASVDKLIDYMKKVGHWNVKACNEGGKVGLLGELSGNNAPCKYFVVTWGLYDATDSNGKPLKKVLEYESLTVYAVSGSTVEEAANNIYFD